MPQLLRLPVEAPVVLSLTSSLQARWKRRGLRSSLGMYLPLFMKKVLFFMTMLPFVSRWPEKRSPALDQEIQERSTSGSTLLDQDFQERATSRSTPSHGERSASYESDTGAPSAPSPAWVEDGPLLGEGQHDKGRLISGRTITYVGAGIMTLLAVYFGYDLLSGSKKAGKTVAYAG